ncbi:glycine zipper 2TM domain-containing protein [Klebsiella aerogenes]|uniref:glycine zipper 2TM domain-containing protein n=1 Tax=Klebsiella aerogenes TaxID=548 RepID=UPI002D7E253A|nr:glycine zipper 2TM domain-containing protein [Klebsiella aerogenes]
MKKFLFIALGMTALFSQAGVAGTKTLVDYGVVQESHIISSPHQRQPLRTLAAGTLGGVVGHQFGNGKGQTAMTAAGALAGAGASRYHQGRQQGAQQVELLIKTNGGQVIQVLQGYDSRLVFNKGDKVRILTSGNDTRVDKSV